MPFIDGLKHILRTEGLGGVYQGAFATALKQGSNQGLRFMWFNEYKNAVTNGGEITLSPIMALFGGMSAGCFSTLGNNPFDVVKVRKKNFLLHARIFFRDMLMLNHLTAANRPVCKGHKHRNMLER